MQAYMCTVVRFTSVQVYACRCTGVQVYRCAVVSLLSRTERRTHKRDTKYAHTHTHITVRCIHNCWPMCRCVCASVKHRPNPDSQPFLFSVCNNMRGTCQVPIVFRPGAVRFTRKGVRSRFFRSCRATSNCLHPSLDSARV
jgi:hypothetical protein